MPAVLDEMTDALDSNKLQHQEETDSDMLTLTLGGVHLVFEGGKWKAKSDLDIAALEINQVMDERDNLIANTNELTLLVTALQKEILEINETNKMTLNTQSKMSARNLVNVGSKSLLTINLLMNLLMSRMI